MNWLNEFPVPNLRRDHSSGLLELGGASVAQLARTFGTPLYLYDFDRIASRAEEINSELRKISEGSRAFYAMKALSNISVLKVIHGKGLGMDVVSGGEIERALAAGVTGGEIVFSGVAKTEEEIRLGIREKIACFNIESPHEVAELIRLAKGCGHKVPVALRINPDVDGKTHAKINTGLAETKFGLSPELAKKLTLEIMSSTDLSLLGVSCHIGSQIFDLNTIKAAALSVKDFALELLRLGAPITHVDMGGGLGVAYGPTEETPQPSFSAWVEAAKNALPDKSFDLHLEPGRSIVADAGILVTEVIDIKPAQKKTFAIVDAGMTELVRPAMYDAYHHVTPVEHKDVTTKFVTYDVVGPVCETSCWLASGVKLPELKRNDLVAILTAGAYGMSMASNYNTRNRPAEVAVISGKAKVIRKRETLRSLWESELV